MTDCFSASPSARVQNSGSPFRPCRLPHRRSCLNRLRSSPSSYWPTSFLAPAFNAVAVAGGNIDPSLLRYRRSNSTRGSSPSPLSPMENLQALLPSARSILVGSPVYKTPVKDAVAHGKEELRGGSRP